MVKPIAAAVISVAFASSDVMSDEGLSLLQMRAQKHDVQQPLTLADGSVLEVRPGGSLCEADEVITFAKCVEAQIRNVVPNTMAHGVVYNNRGAGWNPTGCWQLGGNMYFNDEPGTEKNGHNGVKPICQAGGGGGRAAEIIAQGISCQEPTCVQPAGSHKMTWDDSVFVPELTIGAAGTVCEEACGLLTYEQCEKATDMGLVEALIPSLAGKLVKEMYHQTWGGSRAKGSNPSACSVHTEGGNPNVYFSSVDTPSGAFAAPGTDGDPLVTPSGVGVGWSYQRPICGVCTTTTTPAPQVDPIEEAPEVEDDAAAAVGDPHMSSDSGEKFDLEEDMLNTHH